MGRKNNTPAIRAASSHGTGTTSEFADYITGDLVTCLSQGEMMLYYILRWNDDVDHIETQVPLDNQIIDKIVAEIYHEEVPENVLNDDNRKHLSTDLVAYLRNGTRRAYQVKASRNQLKGNRDMRRLYIEDLYWKSLNVPWKLMFTEDIHKSYVDNIKRAVRYYKKEMVHDKVSEYQHLVAAKQVKINLDQESLDWMSLANAYFSEHDEKSV